MCLLLIYCMISLSLLMLFSHEYVTVNESQMEIPTEKGQDCVWHVEQRNKKTYLKFDVGEGQENVE